MATSHGLKSTGEKKDNTAEHGLGVRVVKTLASDFKGKYHHVLFDNYFTTLKLLEDLEDDIYSCGTARKGFPECSSRLN